VCFGYQNVENPLTAANVLISGAMNRFGGITARFQRGTIRFLVQNAGWFPPSVVRGPNNIAKST